MTTLALQPFSAINVGFAPQRYGVYFLYDYRELIYVGRALGVTIRERLSRHLRGDEGPSTQSATHFTYLEHAYPAEAERVYLLEFRRTHGRLPRCNQVMPG
jgi:hypothetical protein